MNRRRCLSSDDIAGSATPARGKPAMSRIGVEDGACLYAVYAEMKMDRYTSGMALRLAGNGVGVACLMMRSG